MAASTALRLLLGASLGLGALDVAWIDLALAPRATETGAPAAAPSVPSLRATRGAVSEPAAIPAAPEPPPPAASPRAPEVGTRVYFATQSAALDASARMAVQQLARDPSAVFVLEGHADYRGGEGLNRTLSRDRARAVADDLARAGVPRARIHVGWVGDAGSTASDELWRDRRVDIHIGAGQ
jgi:outer membrane protein OmpA-like peptidoglycan-associated protein